MNDDPDRITPEKAAAHLRHPRLRHPHRTRDALADRLAREQWQPTPAPADPLAGIIRCPEGMPPAVVNMLQATITGAWKDFTPPTDPTRVSEAFWRFLTTGHQEPQ